MLSPIIIALDFEINDALNLASKLDPSECKLKVGYQLFTAGGPDVIEKLKNLGFDIFLDLKFHDIPSTVYNAVKNSMEIGIWMLNVHAAGGGEMLKAASSAIESSEKKPILLGVTLLTSLNKGSLREIGFGSDVEVESLVIRFAKLCRSKGLDGVVCSPQEIKSLRKEIGKDFVLVTPGIRSNQIVGDDQKRTTSPSKALREGADYIVVGREVTLDNNPSEKVRQILENIPKQTLNNLK
tara:strand:+ start:757 stop:1473 length:717 start_codon:yes stop_codon:yes gene_type:complete